MTDRVTEGPPPPSQNPALLFHREAEARLLGAFRSGRLPHAWLLTGPRGVGKATLAYRFARFVLERDRPGAEGANGNLLGEAAPETLSTSTSSEAFRLVASGSHPDLRTLARLGDDAGKVPKEISVDLVRRALSFIHLTPAIAMFRVILVDAAEDLSRSAANALLKALEEPPPRTLFLLVSHAPGRLLPTIRSRCCRLSLAPLPETVVNDLLEQFAPGLDPGDRVALARLADGSIGRALELAAHDGLELYRTLAALVSDLPAMDVQAVQKLGDRVARDQSGTAFRIVMELLLGWVGSQARLLAGGPEPLEITGGETATMRRLAGALGLAKVTGLWEKVADLSVRAETANLDRRQAFMAAFMALAARRV